MRQSGSKLFSQLGVIRNKFLTTSWSRVLLTPVVLRGFGTKTVGVETFCPTASQLTKNQALTQTILQKYDITSVDIDSLNQSLANTRGCLLRTTEELNKVQQKFAGIVTVVDSTATTKSSPETINSDSSDDNGLWLLWLLFLVWLYCNVFGD